MSRHHQPVFIIDRDGNEQKYNTDGSTNVRLPGEWAEKASADNALAIASKAAEVDKTHIITGAHASYSGSVTGLLQIKDGVTVIFEQYVVNSEVIPLNIETTSGNAVSAELAASGTLGVIGKVNLTGYTL
jgi:hypothetical protein